MEVLFCEIDVRARSHAVSGAGGGAALRDRGHEVWSAGGGAVLRD